MGVTESQMTKEALKLHISDTLWGEIYWFIQGAA